MKAMLIGGAGFVGKHLAIHLANTYGWEIVITGLPEEREAIERSSLGRFVPVNILEKGQIQAVLEQERPLYFPSGSTEFRCSFLEESAGNH